MRSSSVTVGSESTFDARALLATPGEGRSVLRYRQSKFIAAQGDLDDCMFYILQGKVRLEFLSEDGKQAILAILGAGEFFGQTCLVSSTRQRLSACAVTDCTVVRLEKSFVQRLLKEQPQFSEFFLSVLLRRIMRMQEDIINHLINSSRRRLARVLLLLAYDQETPSETISPHISHEVLAEMVGTTRSRVNAFMNDFRRLGFIEYNSNGNLRVHSALVQVLLRG